MNSKLLILATLLVSITTHPVQASGLSNTKKALLGTLVGIVAVVAAYPVGKYLKKKWHERTNRKALEAINETKVAYYWELNLFNKGQKLSESQQIGPWTGLFQSKGINNVRDFNSYSAKLKNIIKQLEKYDTSVSQQYSETHQQLKAAIAQFKQLEQLIGRVGTFYIANKCLSNIHATWQKHLTDIVDASHANQQYQKLQTLIASRNGDYIAFEELIKKDIFLLSDFADKPVSEQLQMYKPLRDQILNLMGRLNLLHAMVISTPEYQAQEAQWKEQRRKNIFYHLPAIQPKLDLDEPDHHECTICLEDKNKPDLSRLACGHTFCTGCLTHIVDNAFAEKRTAQLRCPNPDCAQQMTERDVRKITKNSQEKLAAYANITAHEWLAKQPNVRYCPTPNCPQIFLNEGTNAQVMRCMQCNHEYCSNCLYQHAQNITCEHAGKGRVQAGDEWVQQHTKPCPQCKIPIEKADGCDWMKCFKCKYEFCWKCLGPHDHNVYAHKCRQ